MVIKQTLFSLFTPVKHLSETFVNLGLFPY